jgi:hypothetical protein
MTPEERAGQIVDDALWYDNTAYICNEPSRLRAAIAAALSQAEEEAAYFRQMNERLIAQLERQQPRWIPVAERLPEPGDLVPAYRPLNGYTPVIVSVTNSAWLKRMYTHWQPVPPAPTD